MANLVHYCPHFLKVQQIGRSVNPILTEGGNYSRAETIRGYTTMAKTEIIYSELW